MSYTVLVGSDGSTSALGALRLAQKLEARDGCRVEVIGVVEPVPVFDTGFLVALPEMELYESRRDALRHEIEGQVQAVRGSRSAWSLDVDTGVPAPRIVKRAEALNARLILLGMGRHGPMERVLGTETALQVLRLADIPVLAVPHNCTDLPRTAVMGVDFSGFSVRAVKAATMIMMEPWTAHLAYVMSGMEFLPSVSGDWRSEYETDLGSRFDSVIADVEAPAGCTTTQHVLEGEPAHELIGLVGRTEADLIVAGSHGHSFVGRLLTGSVSTRLIRSAEMPVLVAPPETPRKEETQSREGQADSGIAREVHPWVRALDGFTKRNAGRRTTLELDDPELGAQCSGRNFPLRGVSYDPRRNRLQIMLGRTGTVENHLTHSIPSPKSVEIVTDDEGRDLALHIDLDGAQLILKVHRE
jgi:nucleotide-binding universal stress UspA family protein